MRAAKLMTFYVLPLIALFVYFLPNEAPAVDPSMEMERRSVAQSLMDLYDFDKDQLLTSYELPLTSYQEIDCNGDYQVSEREINYYLNVKSKNLIGDYTYFDAMPAESRMVGRPGTNWDNANYTPMRWYLR